MLVFPRFTFGSCWLLFGHLHVCDGVGVLSAVDGWILPSVVSWVFLGVFLLVCHCLGHLLLCLGVVCDLSRSSARLGTHQFCLHKVCRVYGVDNVAVCDIPSTHNILGYGLFMIHCFLGGSVSGSRQYAYTVAKVGRVLILLGSGLGFVNQVFVGGSVGFTCWAWVVYDRSSCWVGLFMSVLSCGWQCLGESAICLHCCESL